MKLVKSRYLFAIALIARLAVAPLLAAEPEPAPSARKEIASTAATLPVVESAKSESATATVEEVRPRVYYLPDKKGRLQAVVDFPYEEFVDLYKLRQGLVRGEESPRFTIDRVILSGRATGDRAELRAEIKITSLDSAWTRVPLFLNQAAVIGSYEAKGVGEQFIESAGAEGYAAWIRGDVGSSHEFVIKLVAPLNVAGDETKLRLRTSRATAFELNFVAPGDVDAAVSADSSLRITKKTPEGDTELSAVGLNGDWELSWRKKDRRSAERALAWECEGTHVVRVDSMGVVWDSLLRLRNRGEPIDRFRIRLPKDAEVVPDDRAAFSMRRVEAENAESAEKGNLFEIKLPKAFAETSEVRFKWRRNSTKVDSDWTEMLAPEAIGAARQWGVVAFAAVAGKQWTFGEQKGVLPTDSVIEALRGEESAVAFQYVEYPYSLSARLTPRRIRVRVEPTYVLSIESNRATLDCRLRYDVRGGKIDAVQLRMPGWTLDEAEPENLIIADAAHISDKLAKIPFRQPTAGQVEVRLRASRALPAGDEKISLKLPQIENASTDSVVVAAIPADNVELISDETNIRGLTRSQDVATIRLPERRQDATFYQGDGKEMVFAAEKRVHSREVKISATARLEWDEDQIRVERQFHYAVEYEPIDHIDLEAPPTLANVGAEFLRGGKPLTVTVVSAKDGEPTRLRVALAEPTLGAFTVAARYAVSARSTTAARFETPLLTPLDGELTSDALRLTAASGRKITAVDPHWKEVKSDSPNPSSRDLFYRAEGHATAVILEAAGDDPASLNNLIVERAWLQTWLGVSNRQDRAAMQISTNRREITLRLPEGVMTTQLAVILDGKRAESQLLDDRRLRISLAGDRQWRRYWIELRYNFINARPPQGRMSLAQIRFDEDVWVRRLYWQLILPPYEHVLFNPQSMIGEFHWQWRDAFWGRQAIMGQAELETWAGVAQRASLPEGVNAYLYSAMGDVGTIELRTAGRPEIVLFASGFALFVGLALIYLPAIRHPATALTLFIVAVSLGLIYPEPTFLLLQASLIGLGLSVFAGILAKKFARRGRDRFFAPQEALIDLGSTREIPIVISSMSASNSRYVPPIAGEASTQSVPSLDPDRTPPSSSADPNAPEILPESEPPIPPQQPRDESSS